MATRQTTDAPLKHLRDDDERVSLGRRAGYGAPAGSDTDEERRDEDASRLLAEAADSVR